MLKKIDKSNNKFLSSEIKTRRKTPHLQLALYGIWCHVTRAFMTSTEMYRLAAQLCHLVEIFQQFSRILNRYQNFKHMTVSCNLFPLIVYYRFNGERGWHQSFLWHSASAHASFEAFVDFWKMKFKLQWIGIILLTSVFSTFMLHSYVYYNHERMRLERHQLQHQAILSQTIAIRSRDNNDVFPVSLDLLHEWKYRGR